ncbi:hypothetical protein ACHAXT_000653 [Thalassiosira profunda]
MKRPALLLLISAASIGGGSAQYCNCGSLDCAEDPCPPGYEGWCCSQYGYCGNTDTHCGDDCCSGCPGGVPGANCPLVGPPSPTTPPPQPAPSTPPPVAQPTGGEPCSADPLVAGPCPDPSHCCSIYGYCDYGADWCAPGNCADGPCWDSPSGPTNPPVPTNPPAPLPTFSPATTFDTVTDDSRLIAYVGNWQACPTDEQVAQYTHIVIAFAVTYSWSGGPVCNTDCSLMPTLVCNNQDRPDLVSQWQAAGKKVILSIGGANMGGSWDGVNNCWDYCFGKEEELSQALVDVVETKGYDGIDVDYEYCYDTAGGHGACNAPTYSDAGAQTFLKGITEGLRAKLDSLSLATQKHYELTHAPMDADMQPDREYYQILKDRHMMLDFLMPQFYNSITRPALDGFDGSGFGDVKSSVVYTNLATDLFPNRPDKVVFGFCISDCGPTNSNANGNQAVQVLQEIKTYDQQQYACNGGAFFWVALHDTSPGAWSDPVATELAKTAGCSATGTPAPSTSPTARPTATPGPTSSPSKSPTGSPSRPPSSGPTSSPSQSPTAFPTEQFPGTCSDGSGSCAKDDTSTCSCHNMFERKLLRTGKLAESQQTPAKTGKLLRSVLKGAR